MSISEHAGRSLARTYGRPLSNVDRYGIYHDAAQISQWEQEEKMRGESIKRAQLENKYLEQEMRLREQQQKRNAQMASKYLNAWNQMLGQAGGLFNSAIEQANKAYQYLDGDSGSMAELENLTGTVMQEFQDFKTQTADLDEAGVASAYEDLQRRSRLGEQLEQYATADLEGEATRAKADVATESEGARRAMITNELVGRGIDPTSGRGRTMLESTYMNEALGKTFAGNQARQAEKQRAGEVAGMGMQVIDPNVGAGISRGLRETAGNLLNLGGTLQVAGTEARTKRAQTAADIAKSVGQLGESYGRTLVQPVGEFGAGLYGMSQAS